MAKRKTRPEPTQFPFEEIEGATGASDATSGGGAGAGNPEPDTVARTGGRVLRGNVQEDKKKLFPERFGKTTASRQKKSATARKPAGSSRSAGGSTRGKATASKATGSRRTVGGSRKR
ncbi:MAG TPA: hypothetical protein VF669_05530 [Tepidisphaeraceae bacterium]|jgi:hypothetical protein